MKSNIFQSILRVILIMMTFSFSVISIQAQSEIKDSLVSERLQFMKKSLEREKVQTQRWWWSWLGIYSAATIGQGAVYLTSDNKSLRQDMLLGAATTLLGAANQFISPLIPNKKTEQFNLLPENSSEEKYKKLARAEELLQECIRRETLSRNWQSHALCSVVNIGGGLITWLGFKRTIWDGLLNFAINEAVTETQLWTSPTLARRNYKNYCRKYLNQDNAVSYMPEVKWYLGAYPGGIGLKVVF